MNMQILLKYIACARLSVQTSEKGRENGVSLSHFQTFAFFMSLVCTDRELGTGDLKLLPLYAETV